MSEKEFYSDWTPGQFEAYFANERRKQMALRILKWVCFMAFEIVGLALIFFRAIQLPKLPGVP